MRSAILGLSILGLAALGTGCSSGAKPGDAAATAAAAATTSYTWQSDGTNVLKLAIPADAKTNTAMDKSLHVKNEHFELEFWVVPGVTTVDDAVAKIPTQIVTEFKDFSTKNSSDLTVAGAPAKRLTSTGHEADDGDDGEADVIVFKAGDHVFIACTHGEKLNANDHAILLTVVQSAQTP